MTNSFPVIFIYWLKQLIFWSTAFEGWRRLLNRSTDCKGKNVKGSKSMLLILLCGAPSNTVHQKVSKISKIAKSAQKFQTSSNSISNFFWATSRINLFIHFLVIQAKQPSNSLSLSDEKL